MLWAMLERKKIFEKFPTYNNAEICKMLGDNWHSLTEAQRKPFILEARRQRIQHMSDYPDYKRKQKKLEENNQCFLPHQVSVATIMPMVGSAGDGQRAVPFAPHEWIS
ncbi:unnamed protein product [Staurois parvus]|uniref:HMG box domain-containing protein n=1 Tax=Staurois parvus TaxID=386267 RepID=A0ABN9BRL5_9NEOB|nr:unnamed protein product [Staurois parvus]